MQEEFLSEATTMKKQWSFKADARLYIDYDARVHTKSFFGYILKKTISGNELRDDKVTVDNIEFDIKHFF